MVHTILRPTVLLLISGALAAALLAPGCSGRDHPDVAAGRTGSPLGDLFSAHKAGDTLSWEYESIDVIEVDVESFNGDVVVVANDELDMARVTVTPQSVHGHMRGDDAEASLQRVHAEVVKEAGNLGPVIRVRNTTDDPEPHYLRAHVYIEAPAIEGVRIRTGVGNILMKELTGAVDAETGGGNVRLMTPLPMTRPVTVVSQRGSIDYRIRGESTGAFDMETVGGIIKLRCRYGRWIAADPGNRRDRLTSVLNDGANPVILRTVDGDIRIAIVDNPMEVGMFILDP